MKTKCDDDEDEKGGRNLEEFFESFRHEEQKPIVVCFFVFIGFEIFFCWCRSSTLRILMHQF